MNRISEIGNIHNNNNGGNSSIVPSTTSDSADLIPYKLFSISEVARILGVGKDTIYNLLQTGQLGFIEIGKRKKISLMEIHKFISKNTKYQSAQEKNNLFDDLQIKKILYPSNHKKKKSIDGGKILERIMRTE